MTQRIRTTVIVTGVGCLVLVATLLVGMDAAAMVAKLIASCGFVAIAFLGGALHSTYGRILLAGLLLSLLGDAFLIGEDQRAFLSGLAAFLLAHLAYVAAFAVHGVSLRWMAVAALPVIGVATSIALWLAPQTPPELALPVNVYTVVISSMVIAAIGTRGKDGTVLILIGAVLFFLSDLSVASLRLTQTTFPHYIWGLPLYYAGQVCLALSVSQSRSH